MSLLSILPNINLVGNPGISLGKKGQPTRGGCALTVEPLKHRVILESQDELSGCIPRADGWKYTFVKIFNGTNLCGVILRFGFYFFFPLIFSKSQSV